MATKNSQASQPHITLQSTASDIIQNLVLTNLVVVLQVVLADPNKKKKFRKVLVQARDILNQALPPDE